MNFRFRFGFKIRTMSLINFYTEKQNKININLFNVDCNFCHLSNCSQCEIIEIHLFEIWYGEPEEDDEEDEFQVTISNHEYWLRYELQTDFKVLCKSITHIDKTEMYKQLVNKVMEKNITKALPDINDGDSYIAALCLRNFLKY